MTMMSTMGRMRSTWPMVPVMKTSEPNTSSVVANEDIMPGSTCFTPSIAACIGVSPLDMRAAIFSAMTMASSISRPTPMSRPTMDIMLMVTPIAGSMKKAPRNETGSPMVTQKL